MLMAAAVATPYAEPERLQAVRSYAIPDAPHAKRLDIFTRLAARICQTPMSALSLVDEEKVYLKSAFGAEAGVRQRLATICTLTIADPDAVLVIDDAREDERVRHIEVGRQRAPVRFYAGVPLCDRDGFALGALCVYDVKPRHMRPDQLALLRSLAQGAVASMAIYRSEAEDDPFGRRKRKRSSLLLDAPATEWELMADWLAEAHPEAGRQVTDSWVAHYVNNHPKLVERLKIHAGQQVDLDCSIP